MKKFLIALACVAFVVLLSLGIAAACVVRGANHLSFNFSQDEKASRQETVPLEIAAGELLDVDLDSGTVRVKASADGAPSIAATITAYGSTQEKADAALAATKLEVVKSAEGVRVRLSGGANEESLFGGTTVRSHPEANLEIRVPAGARLAIESGSGDLDGVGPFAASRLHSSYGSVKVHGVDGELEATSSSGDVTVETVKGKKLVAKSDYGNVRAADSECPDVRMNSSSGDVDLARVRGEHLRVGSGYGNVTMLAVAGEIEAKLSSGDVKLEDWTGARAKLKTSYGNVRVAKAVGALEAESSSGEVTVRDYEGALEAHSSYGSVQLEGVFSGLKADSSSGEVSARALKGSRIEGDWRLSSSYGNVSLAIPEGLGCELDADTAYGDVAVGFPVEVQPGSRKKGEHAVRGKVNGGGGRIELHCTSGSIKVGASAK
jgi:DUF4097 and DUF4098 domain-containing protein YvlB